MNGTDEPAASAPLDLLPRDSNLGRVQVTRAAVLAAAPAAPAGSSDVASVNVDGRLVRAYELVALATGHPTTRISSRQALRALQQLGFPVEPNGAASLPHTGTATAAARPPHPNAPDPNAGPAVDPAVLRELRRHPGEWAAIRGRIVVAHAATLGEVLERARPNADDPATVLWVPRNAQEATDGR